MLDQALIRLYKALKIGQFIFVEDDFESAKNKSELIYDFTRMNSVDRKALIEEIPDGCPSKVYLSQYVEHAESWFESIDFSLEAPNDIEFVITKKFGEDSDIYKLYCAIGEDVLAEPCKAIFTKYGVGITIPPAFLDLFDGVIRSDRYYLSTRVYLDYKEETHAEMMSSIDKWWRASNLSTALVLDNMIDSSRNAEQMIKDLVEFKKSNDAQVFAVVYSSAEQNTPQESYAEGDFYISYVRKGVDISGIHKSIVHAATNQLIQKSKEKYIEIIQDNYNLLAANPELVDYLYSMANKEGAAGFEVIQHWISTINDLAMEKSEELKSLTKISTCLDAYHDVDSADMSAPPLLFDAVASEFFSYRINQYYSITAPGDVFLFNGKYYVLVGQECDYMMGEGRDRNVPLCELLEAEAIPQTQYDKLVDNGSSVQISNFKTPEGRISTLKIHCNRRRYIRNEILNLCCFNSDGECMIDPTENLPTDCQELIQPYLIDYYKDLQKVYRQLLIIKETHPDFDTLLNGLHISVPLIDYSSYERQGNIIKFPIKRCSRIKERASLYLNKLFLDYRGRIPYTSIHLLGYEVLSVTIESKDYQGELDVYIKQTTDRNKNRKPDKRALTWYIKTRDLKKHITKIGYDAAHLEDLSDDFFEFKGKDNQTLYVNGHSLTLIKSYSEKHHRIKVNEEELVPI